LEDLLGLPAGIHIRAVEEVDPGFPAAIVEFAGHLFISFIAKGHGAKT